MSRPPQQNPLDELIKLEVLAVSPSRIDPDSARRLSLLRRRLGLHYDARQQRFYDLEE